ncbi:hypothetical protein B0H11DRAFT_1987517 [Mycena galericulata]|nr:hypothetical protein B0H11DRAFT_1987517 [Mycena galericulata]
MSKKRSGLSGAKAAAAHETILQLKRIVFPYDPQPADGIEEEEDEANAEVEKEHADLQDILNNLDRILGRSTQATPLSTKEQEDRANAEAEKHAAVQDIMSRLDRVFGRSATPLFTINSEHTQEELLAIVSQRANLGANHVWTAKNMHDHLNFLERTVPKQAEGSARLWINTLFFRASAMLPEDSPGVVVLHLEASVPTKQMATSVSDIVDYLVITVPEERICHVLEGPQLRSSASRTSLSGLFVAELKFARGDIIEYLPEVLVKQYACALRLERPALRGVLTDGHRWVFTILKCKPNGGAIYRTSNILSLDFDMNVHGPNKVRPGNVDLIVAILADSILNGYTDGIQPYECFLPMPWQNFNAEEYVDA